MDLRLKNMCLLKSLLLSVGMLFCFSSSVAIAEKKTEVNVEKLATQNWISVSTKNFEITSNDKVKRIEALAVELENFRYFISRFMGLKQVEGLPPVKFLILKNDRSFGYLGFKNIGGIFKAMPEGFFSVANGDDFNLKRKLPTWGRHVIFHEMIHYFVSNQFEKEKFPLWYREGIAEYLATMIHNKRKQKITFGQFGSLKWRFYSLRNNAGSRFDSVDVESLFKARTIAPADITNKEKKRREVSRFYARAFAVTHYLNSNKKRLSELRQFIKLYNTNRSIDDAFSESFDVTYEQLTKEVDDYINGRNVFARVFKAGDDGIHFPKVTPATVSLAQDEGVYKALDIRLKFRRSEWYGDYDDSKLVEEFQLMFPDSKKLNLFVAKYDTTKTVAQRIEYAKRYLNANKKHSQAHLILGRLYLRQAYFARIGGDPQWLEINKKARSSLRRAIKLDIFSGLAYQGLGVSYRHTPYDEPTIEEGLVSYDILSMFKNNPWHEQLKGRYALDLAKYEDAAKYYASYIDKAYQGGHTGFHGYVRDALKMREIATLEVVDETDGRLQYIDGSIYQGDIVDSLPQGSGVLNRPTGDKYDGQWNKGYAHGVGSFTSSNGMVYTGEFEDGIAHGQGDLVYKSKHGLQRYKGSFYRFMEHGLGEAWYADEYRLVGQWSKGFVNGTQKVLEDGSDPYEVDMVWNRVKKPLPNGGMYIGTGFDFKNNRLKDDAAGRCKFSAQSDFVKCQKVEGKFLEKN